MRIKSSYSQVEDGDKVRVELKVGSIPNLTITKQIIRNQNLVVITEPKPRFEVGDRLEATGKADVRVTGLFGKEIVLNYPSILLIESVDEGGFRLNTIESDLLAFSYYWQRKLSLLLTRDLPEPHGSLLAGILLGIRGLMPDRFYKALIETGTLHVIAASGYNITIVAKLVIYSFSRVMRRQKAAIFSLAAIAFYALIAGASPAVVRAAIMGGLTFLAQAMGRENLSSWSLVLTAMVMLLVNPFLLTDVGFWLSVTATGGILWLSRPVQLAIEGVSARLASSSKSVETISSKTVWSGALEVLKTDLVTTLAAQAATLPIIIVVFERVSVVSPLVNVLILWLVPIIMALGGIYLVVSTVLPWLSPVVAWLVWLPLEVFIKVVELFGSFSFASFEVLGLSFEKSTVFPVIFTLGYYLSLVTIVLWVKRGWLEGAEKRKL